MASDRSDTSPRKARRRMVPGRRRGPRRAGRPPAPRAAPSGPPAEGRRRGLDARGVTTLVADAGAARRRLAHQARPALGPAGHPVVDLRVQLREVVERLYLQPHAPGEEQGEVQVVGAVGDEGRPGDVAVAGRGRGLEQRVDGAVQGRGGLAVHEGPQPRLPRGGAGGLLEAAAPGQPEVADRAAALHVEQGPSLAPTQALEDEARLAGGVVVRPDEGVEVEGPGRGAIGLAGPRDRGGDDERGQEERRGQEASCLKCSSTRTSSLRSSSPILGPVSCSRISRARRRATSWRGSTRSPRARRLRRPGA